MTDSGGDNSKQNGEMEDLDQSGMEWGDDHDHNQYYFFLPLSHPIEPPDEDRPVKCPPLPQSSTTILMDNNNNDETIVHDQKFTIGLRKREDLVSSIAEKATYFDTPPHPVRKRHHALTCGDIIFAPPPITSPRFSFPAKDNASILRTFQQLE
ncbi:uncharacterized protein LOC124937007 [Impatiens glandulifera]|uniref:uncharacterized protein LOC124937007 n=1 Tax=Impatiens glandulifera TaxID=253017 RepID=UPI001FB12554|nr:uncharacterized protein LOC124937007 [Impatiens glandulifera]